MQEVLGQESASEVVVRVEERTFLRMAMVRRTAGHVHEPYTSLHPTQEPTEADDEGAQDELAEDRSSQKRLRVAQKLSNLLQPRYPPNQILTNGTVHPAPWRKRHKLFNPTDEYGMNTDSKAAAPSGESTAIAAKAHVLRKVKVILHQVSEHQHFKRLHDSFVRVL